MKEKCLLFYYFTEGGLNAHSSHVIAELLQKKLEEYTGKKTR